MYRGLISAMYALNIVFQGLFTLLMPIGAALGISYLAVTYGGAPSWLYAILIPIGAALGMISMIRFILIACKNLERLERMRENKRKEDESLEKNE